MEKTGELKNVSVKGAFIHACSPWACHAFTNCRFCFAATSICGFSPLFSHVEQAYFLRTCWMRSKRPGMYSIC